MARLAFRGESSHDKHCGAVGHRDQVCNPTEPSAMDMTNSTNVSVTLILLRLRKASRHNPVYICENAAWLRAHRCRLSLLDRLVVSRQSTTLTHVIILARLDEVTRLMQVLELDLKEKNLLPPSE